jgi:hypothetical protein
MKNQILDWAGVMIASCDPFNCGLCFAAGQKAVTGRK